MKIWFKAKVGKLARGVTGIVLSGVMITSTIVPVFAVSATETTDAEVTSSEQSAPETTNTPEPSPSPTPQPTPMPPSAPTPEDTQPSLETTEESESEEAAEDTEEEPIVAYPQGISPQGDNETIALSNEKIMEIINSMPDGVSAERVAVVLKAYSLVGKVSYFWGGKSSAVGWDVRWGNIAYVFSQGSSSSGTYRPYGMDCSGYVAWAFSNAVGYSVSEDLGISTAAQWKLSEETTWEKAQPGDITLFNDPGRSGSINHVGIVVGWDDEGELLVAHCASSKGTVVVTRAKETGFNYVRTPNIYKDEQFDSTCYDLNGLGTYLLWNSTTGIDITDTETGMLRTENVDVGDLVFSGVPVLGEENSELTIGIVVGFDGIGNPIVSMPPAEVEEESDVADIEEETAENSEAAEVVDGSEADSESEATDSPHGENNSDVITIPVDMLHYSRIRKIESQGVLNYYKGEVPVFKVKQLYGGKDAHEDLANAGS